MSLSDCSAAVGFMSPTASASVYLPTMPRVYSLSPEDVSKTINIQSFQPDHSPDPPSVALGSRYLAEPDEMPDFRPNGPQRTRRSRTLSAADDEYQMSELDQAILREGDDAETIVSDVKSAFDGESEDEGHRHSKNTPTPRFAAKSPSTTTPIRTTTQRSLSTRSRSRSVATTPHVTQRTSDKPPTKSRDPPGRSEGYQDITLEDNDNTIASDDLASENDDFDGVEDVEVEGLRQRELRKRKLQQVHPYKYEKHEHNMMTKSGKEANTDKVEKAVQNEICGTRRQRIKMTKAESNNANPGQVTRSARKKSSKISRRSSLVASSTTSTTLPYEADLSRASLRIWLDGFSGASTAIMLKECSGLGKLMEFILKSWEWKFNFREFSYAIASFPWLSSDSNVLIRPGLTESFQKIVSEIENSPVWADGDKAQCEVKVVVFLQ